MKTYKTHAQLQEIEQRVIERHLDINEPIRHEIRFLKETRKGIGRMEVKKFKGEEIVSVETMDIGSKMNEAFFVVENGKLHWRCILNNDKLVELGKGE